MVRENEKDNYWLGFVVGIAVTFFTFLSVGIADHYYHILD